MSDVRPVLFSALLATLGACAPHAPPAANAPAQSETPASSPQPTASPLGFRLPRTARPLAYRAALTVDPSKDTIEGEEEIDVERTAPGALVLSAHELDVTRAGFRGADGSTVALQAHVVDGERIALAAADGHELPAGRATVSLAWRARVHHGDTEGAFAQKTDGEWYEYSQFEATAARRVFPCFDEPGFKVPWQLTLSVPAGLTALSNTPVEREETAGALTRFTFAQTPPLPSYLIAFAVGHFQMVDAGHAKSGAPIRVALPAGQTPENAAIPVEDSAPILSLEEDYFGTPYPFGKLDLVPIPDTVGFSAMENPGLITVNASILLSKPQDRSFQNRRLFAWAIAHEIAHQWFGDLVTMEWWDDVWLNESFASWMGDRTVQQWMPAWNTDLANVAAKAWVMGIDSRAAARRIREPVNDQNGIEGAFDGITYGKGQAVLTMLEHELGPETFRKGIVLYLAKHARGNATYADLLSALSEASGRDVRTIADDFVDRTGVPLVRFSLDCEKGEKPVLTMTQQRFVPYASTLDPKRTWHVPVEVHWKAGTHEGHTSTVLAGETGTLPLDAPACPDWVMPNAGGFGYYRWTVAGAPFERLLSRKVFAALPPAERLEVASSVAALVGAGEIPYRKQVELAVTLLEDPVRQVRRIGLEAGAGWGKWLPPAMRPAYRRWVARTWGPLAKSTGFVPAKNETDDEKAERATVLARMVEDAEDHATIAQAERLAWKWLDRRRGLSPEMVDQVLAFAAHGEDPKLYDRYLSEARKADRAHDKDERERFLGALRSFRSPALVDRSRAMVLGSEFPILETWPFLDAGTDTPEGRDSAWTFLTGHYDEIVAKLPPESRAHLVRIAADCTQEDLARHEAFFAERTPKELNGPRTFKSFVEGTQLCIAQREKNTPSFVEFLKETSSGGTRRR